MFGVKAEESRSRMPCPELQRAASVQHVSTASITGSSLRVGRKCLCECACDHRQSGNIETREPPHPPGLGAPSCRGGSRASQELLPATRAGHTRSISHTQRWEGGSLHLNESGGGWGLPIPVAQSSPSGKWYSKKPVPFADSHNSHCGGGDWGEPSQKLIDSTCAQPQAKRLHESQAGKVPTHSELQKPGKTGLVDSTMLY